MHTIVKKMNGLNLAHNLEKVVIFVLLFAGKISDIFRTSCQSSFMYDFLGAVVLSIGLQGLGNFNFMFEK